MEDKNKEIQLTDEEIEEVSGGCHVGYIRAAKAMRSDVGQASDPKEVGTAERMKEVK